MANDLKMEVILQAIDRATRPIRAITQGSIGLGQALKESRDKLKQLQATQADVSSFRQAKAASLEQAAALKASQDRVNQLSGALKAQEQVLRPLQSSYDQLQGETDALNTQHKALTQQLRQTREQARAANQVWQDNRKRIRELGQQIGSTNQPAQKLRDEYAALVTQQQAQLALVRRLSAGQKDLQQQHRTSTSSVRQQKERLSELAEQLQEARAPMQGLSQDFRAAAKEAQALKAKHSEQGQKLQALRTRLSAAGISTKTLSQSSRDLKARIQETNDAISAQTRRMQTLVVQQKRLTAARAQFDRSQQVAGSMAAGGAAGIGSAYAISRPLKGIVDAFAPAEDAMTQLKVSMMDSTGTAPEDFKKISDLATGLGDRLPGTTADFQNMMTMLRRQGISAQSILGGTGEAAAYLGVQLKMPVEAAAEFAAKMQDATRTPEKDMMALMDTIQRGFFTGVDPTNMLQGFSKLSPAMGILRKEGLDAVNTFAPLLVMMDQASMAGESAGNALRKVFQSSLNTKKLGKANAVLKDVGLSLDFSDGKGEFGGMEQLYTQLEKLKKLNSMQRGNVMQELFGDDAETLQVVNTMMDKGLAGYQEIAAKLKDQADLRTRVNEQLGTLTNTIEAAEGSWTNAMSEIGATIAPELKGLINGIGELAVTVKTWVGEHPALTAAIVKTAGGLAMLLAVGGGLTVMLASFMGPFAMARYGLTLFGIKSLGAVSALKGLGGAFMWAGKAVLWLGRALMMNPIGLAVMAIAAAAYLVYKYWDPIKAYFLGLWAEIKAGFNAGLAGVAALILNFNPLGLLYRIFAGVMSYFGVQLPGKFSEFGALLMQRMVAGLTTGLAAVQTYLLGMRAEIKAGFNGGLAGVAALILNFNPLGLFYRIFAGVMSYFGVQLPGKFSEFGALLMQRMVAGLTTGLAAVQTYLLGMWAEIKVGFNGGLAGVAALILNFNPLGLFYQVFAGVLSYFGVELPGKFTEFGTMLMQGMVAGITNGLAAVKAAITGAGDSTISWFKEKLGIHSPSRVFASLGGFTMAGLEQGLTQGQKGPLDAVTSMSKQLTAAGSGIELRPGLETNLAGGRQGPFDAITGMVKELAAAGADAIGLNTGRSITMDNRPPLSASPPASAAGGQPPTPIIIQVHAAPGMDEQQLARLVALHVDKIQHKSKVRGRSALSDQE
ncbi:phage tail tape measure protein [Pseudomonas putida]|uniref:phage tail tape measure protein n=1 Tax=Pseudomonas putida TaxID=303 RepID=UPI00300F6A62